MNDDEWAAQTSQPRRRCHTCAFEPAATRTRTLLETILRVKAYRIGAGVIFRRLSDDVPGFAEHVQSESAFRQHLNLHEPLWKELLAAKRAH